ncbi:alpha/beta hydrolase [Citrobacter freundii]|uniref:alpha/beta hydrolase n=1 Tax=Citrobacter freundii TaxID=546 RepID=UPI000A386549|nr:alpha/beta hydrolase [Citrobacter freundii]ELK6343466.1 alpha/beta hydrolase [Citrobacter freundii]MDN4195975.1 alpha/beta hydrolase [Citrobacter freundii]MDN4226505.1 alpha/beta hydrolase [Citrobacter freundii]MDU2487214.1 alpha/beta hydrolase [Citrobacter freundii]OUE66503.1 dienelactone hydrolase domain-containing protein [Citrobacter freundii]
MSHEQVVSFRHNSWQVAATLRLPEGFDANQKYPAIVCAHPISSCKEQTSGAVYGQKLTEAGFITLAFDASTQGESGGEPRFSENPSTRVEDFRCAIDYLVTLAYVDEDRIGVLGVCGGGGYAVSAATIDHRFKAVATVVAANYGRIMREGDSSPDAALRTIDALGKQRTAEARGAAALVVGYIPDNAEALANANINDIDLIEAVDYYTTPRGQKPGSPNKLRLTSTAPALNWDAFAFTEKLLTQPLHIVIGDVPGGFGSYRDGYELYQRARSVEKTLQVVKGVSHYDLYDRPEATAQALSEIIPFFNKHLGT